MVGINIRGVSSFFFFCKLEIRTILHWRLRAELYDVRGNQEKKKT